MAGKVNLDSLNRVLPNRTAGKGTKKRRVSDHHRNDGVAAELAKCNTAAEIGNLGMRFGLSEKEVRARARSAPNFGQYRMVIGNRIRGVVGKIRKAKQKNIRLTVAEAAYPKTAPKVASKPVKKAKKVKKAKHKR